MPEPDSIFSLLGRIRSGDSASEFELWDRYFERLIASARSQLATRHPSERDAEDVVISVFVAAFRVIRSGDSAQIVDRALLWTMLSTLLHDKLRREYRRRRAMKREFKRLADAGSPDEEADWLAHLVDKLPSPDEAAACEEEFRRRIQQLPERLRSTAILKLQLYTNLEIAEQDGVVERTVERRISEIREVWKAMDTDALTP